MHSDFQSSVIDNVTCIIQHLASPNAQHTHTYYQTCFTCYCNTASEILSANLHYLNSFVPEVMSKLQHTSRTGRASCVVWL